MGDVAILETAQHMSNRIHLADIGKELVSQPLPLRRALHQTRDIHEGHPRRNDLLRSGDLRQLGQPCFRHRHLAHVRLDGAKRKIRRLRRRCPCQCVEKCGFPHVRQAYDTGLEAHETIPLDAVGASTPPPGNTQPSHYRPANIPGGERSERGGAPFRHPHPIATPGTIGQRKADHEEGPE